MNEPIVPRHVGYIVDGNRRWAKQHGIPTYEGHLAGYNALKDVLLETIAQGVEFVSLYTFSTENWKRATDEVNHLMRLSMRIFKTDLKVLTQNNLRLLVLGTRDQLPAKMCEAIDAAEAATAANTGGTVAVCFNYGGQLEIVHAMQSIVEEGIKPEDITIQTIDEHIWKPEVPPVDLIVRTSGEKRLSNFMLWRSPYSEVLFLDKLWPDMTKTDVSDILSEYATRERRLGK